ncbi:MAG: VWA domain-containing protein [Myxococcota bacterium]|nr:VWA domain-containing protein [Myxococcota bacterium]
MSDFQFAEPAWAHALWGVAVFAIVLVTLERRAGTQFRSLVSDALQSRLVSGPSTGQRRARHAFMVLALVFSVLALMRPQWGFEYVERPQVSAELMIALDVSRSMLAEDVAPNRLERAKSEIRDLLEYLAGDQVGLIAFAGRASVLAPMTPDFGFFRLVLDSLGPNSVGRGGTRLEEPIRKAIQGFRATGDVSRVLLLITDGEDHDSFPLEAAKEAALRGVRIIAIGFGAESGSEIPITDPETGARMLLRDSSGEVVRTRLDGDTLREMALLTDGVYVPAGLGSLDLESIYEQHIAGLMRAEIDNEGRVIRAEGFQWFLLAAITCLLVSVMIGQRRRTGATGALASVLLAVVVSAPDVQAQASSPDQQSPAVSDESISFDDPDGLISELDPEPIDEDKSAQEEDDPRDRYNLALDALTVGRISAAQEHFESARASAATDGEARYRATYGLGWASVLDADQNLEAEPQDALNALYRAGDYFREAVRLQPSNEDPRHNLEIVLRRARELADNLAKIDQPDIAAALDALIDRQRTASSETRGLLEQIEDANVAAQLPDTYRGEFRALSTRQRQLLSDSDRFAERVDGDRAAIDSMPEDQRSPDDSARIVQLQQLEIYLQRARERMGHTRRELRGRRGERAFRRANAALAELKRARDQLRDPVEILDVLMRDESELVRYTQTMLATASASADLLAGATGGSGPKAPPWLTVPLIVEGQQSMNERTSELDQRLLAGVAQASQFSPPEPQSQEEAAKIEEQRVLLEQVKYASPFVSAAVAAFTDSVGALELEDLPQAASLQMQGLVALAQARERFLDLRRLIEVAYSDQQRLQNVLDTSQDPSAEVERDRVIEVLPALVEAQQRNVERAARLDELIEAELAKIPDPETLDPQMEEEIGAATQAMEQYQLAKQILIVTEASMVRVVEGIEKGEEEAQPSTPIAATLLPAVTSGEQAVNGLENLRRIFFSMIEHLRDTAQRQRELGDDTEEVAALPDTDQERGLGPLVPRQEALANIAGAIANALEEQSRAEPGDLVGGAGADPNAAPDAEAMAEQAATLRRAAELTLEAQIEMEDVGKMLKVEPSDFAAAREHQGEAHARLLEAIELLTPPEEQEQGDQQQDQQDQQGEQGEQEQQQQQQQQEGAPDQAQQPEQQEADPSQLLQEVRDREAARRKENAERANRGFDTVERDW